MSRDFISNIFKYLKVVVIIMPKVDPDFAKKLTEPEEEEEYDEEGILLDSDEEEVEDISEEELTKYDEKEQAAREAIQDMFLELVEKMERIQNNLTEILEKPTETIAGKYRIRVTEEEMNGLDKMAALNESIITSNIYLKNFIDFGAENTPQFEYIKNLIFKFQQSLNKEQQRTFAIVQKEKYGNLYITKNLTSNYLKGIHIHLSRVIGTLKPAGDYLVTVPPRRDMPNSMREPGEYTGTGQDIYNGEFDQPQLYANSNNWWDQGAGSNFIRRGTKIRKTPRDFGQD